VIGERVQYRPNPPFPSPPFPPNVGPKENPYDSPTKDPPEKGKTTDIHKTPGTFAQPYEEAMVWARQVYWYTCPCVEGGERQHLDGPYDIIRSVERRPDGKYRFTITKDGASATIDPLP